MSEFFEREITIKASGRPTTTVSSPGNFDYTRPVASYIRST
jgi:hypothetical protein